MGMDREAEVRRLGVAERHIADAERHITEHRVALERLRVGGHDTEQAERLLGSMQDTLAAYHEHRRLILELIDQIDAHRA